VALVSDTHPSQRDSDNRVVLLTGAGTGIGLALVRKLWNSDYRIVATARESSLSRLSSPPFRETSRFLIRPLDVTKEAERIRLVDEIRSRWGGVDVLVNNAGISYRSVFEHMSEEDEILQMNTNYLGPIGLIRLVLPEMRAKRSGHIINVSSVGGMMAMPTMGSYSASKFALEGASEALWYELRPWGIRTSLIQPGFIHSNSFRHVYLSERAKKSIADNDDYSAHYEHMSCFITGLMERTIATPESVADHIIATMESKRPALRVPATIDAFFFTFLRRFMPRRLYHWILYRNIPGIKSWGPKRK